MTKGLKFEEGFESHYHFTVKKIDKNKETINKEVSVPVCQ